MKCYNRKCKYNNSGDIDNCTKTSIILDREGKCLDFCPIENITLDYPTGARSSALDEAKKVFNILRKGELPSLSENGLERLN